jgi:uncharacterized protein YcgI (DUF1989 family)
MYDWLSGTFAAGSYASLAADVNGDGRSDLVQWNYSDIKVLLAHPTYAYFQTPATTWHTGAFAGDTANVVGDLDGDGATDFVAWNYTDKYVLLGTNSALGSASPSQWTTDDFAGDYANLIGDINADGRADLVAWNAYDVYVQLSTGSAFSYPSTASSEAFYGEYANLLVVDRK